MVDEEMGRDLLAKGIPILVIGDPTQLPPIPPKKGEKKSTEGFFTKDKPDFMLIEIQQQAHGNPIIELSIKARNRDEIPRGMYGESQVLLGVNLVNQPDVEDGLLLKADQVLVGTNQKRKWLNTHIREVLGRRGPLPELGDKMLCLQNRPELGMMNGSLWYVDGCDGHISRQLLRYYLVPEEGRDNPLFRVPIDLDRRVFEDPTADIDLHFAAFDYGYAITVHKAQGSQWDNVLLYDQSMTFRNAVNKWLYTGITRASKKITIIQS